MAYMVCSIDKIVYLILRSDKQPEDSAQFVEIVITLLEVNYLHLVTPHRKQRLFKDSFFSD